MIVYYRMCNIPSSNPSPILQENKEQLNKLCLTSFTNAFRKVNPKVVFICDFCPQGYGDLIDSLCPFDKDIIFTNSGINETMLLSYRMAREQKDDIILFQECDYFYRENTGEKLEEAIKHYGLVSPYDHLNFYLDKSIHSDTCKIHLFNNQHYRTTERNTMTFGMTREVLEANFESLVNWGYLDNEVWHEMRVKGYPLHVPIPSFATHMVKDYLAPGVDWQSLWKTHI